AGTTVTGVTTDVAPYRAGSGMCVSGSTIVDSTFAAYGALIGLHLANPANGDPVPYNAAAHGIIGFEVAVTGTFTQELRFSFVPVLPYELTSPFVPIKAPGTYQIMMADAEVPASWDVSNAGEKVNPASVTAVELFIAGGSASAPFDVCISSLKPIKAS